jgi:hypothetical protein
MGAAGYELRTFEPALDQAPQPEDLLLDLYVYKKGIV